MSLEKEIEVKRVKYSTNKNKFFSISSLSDFAELFWVPSGKKKWDNSYEVYEIPETEIKNNHKILLLITKEGKGESKKESYIKFYFFYKR